MDKERVSFNLARLKKGGENFEVVIDPDSAILYKTNKLEDIKEVLKSDHIFSDAKKGQLASEEHMKTVFETQDYLEVSKIILTEGEIQLSQEYRIKLSEDKRKKVIDIIHKNGIDPTTNLPHPKTRIENAFNEAKIKIDYYKSAEDQVQDILKEIRVVMPIRIEKKEVKVIIDAQNSQKLYSLVKSYGDILEETWGSDGSWIIRLEVPAGIQVEFFDKLNSATHGNVQTEILK